LSQNQLPAHLQRYQSRDIAGAALANLGSAMPPHISIGSNRFTLIDAANNEIPVPTFDPKIGPYLDAAIIDVADVMSRIFFDGPYDPGAEGKRPDCFSDNGVGPSMGASTPQAPTCAACPRSEWTKINANGNKVPWCTQKYKVAVLIPGFDTVFLLAVPPASHGPLREYLATCKGNGVSPNDLVTRIWFVSQGVLGFAPRPGGPQMAYIDEAVAQLREAAYAEKKTDSMVGRHDVARPAGGYQPAQQIAAPQTIQQVLPNTNAGTGTLAPAGWPQQPAQQQVLTGFAQQPQPQTTGQFGFAQPQGSPQVQQSGPFGSVQTAGWPSTSSGSPSTSSQPATGAATTSPSDQPAGTRRKRRTQAEIAAANGTQAAAGTQQAPFPHPGQQVQQSAPFGATGAGMTSQQGSGQHPVQSASNPNQLEFGIGQGMDANADPAVKGMLDSFFGGPA
jgi:hypothetical protein